VCFYIRVPRDGEHNYKPWSVTLFSFETMGFYITSEKTDGSWKMFS
jgi:hypothetical protein